MTFGFWQVFFIAFALGCDAFSVSLGIGSGKKFKGQAFRLGFHFGLFQFMMPVIGFFIGDYIGDIVQAWDHWIASGILLFIGIHMLKEAIWPDKEEQVEFDRSRGWVLVSLAVATSIDALAVGLALGVMQVSPWWPSALIGIVATIMSVTGLFLGRILRKVFGQVIEIAGGILLIFVAAKFFFM